MKGRGLTPSLAMSIALGGAGGYTPDIDALLGEGNLPGARASKPQASAWSVRADQRRAAKRRRVRRQKQRDRGGR